MTTAERLNQLFERIFSDRKGERISRVEIEHELRDLLHVFDHVKASADLDQSQSLELYRERIKGAIAAAGTWPQFGRPDPEMHRSQLLQFVTHAAMIAEKLETRTL